MDMTVVPPSQVVLPFETSAEAMSHCASCAGKRGMLADPVAPVIACGFAGVSAERAASVLVDDGTPTVCLDAPERMVASALRSWARELGFDEAAAAIRRWSNGPPPPHPAGTSPLWLLRREGPIPSPRESRPRKAVETSLSLDRHPDIFEVLQVLEQTGFGPPEARIGARVRSLIESVSMP